MSKFHSFVERFTPKFLVWAFSFCWLMIVFKTFKIGFMRDLSWYTVCLPVLSFVIIALTYIVLTFFVKRFVLVKSIPLTHKQKREVHRKVKLAKEETEIKKTLRIIVIFVISVIVAYVILC